MTFPQELLLSRLQAAIAASLGPDFTGADPLLRPSQDPRFGDYQANAAMSLGKRLGQNPRDVALRIKAALDVSDVCADVDIAGPGFINLRLKGSYLAQLATSLAHDERLGVAPAATPKTIVVDYSSPNVAKEMHVGHLRSTVIGDALARTFEFLQHRVLRHNHLGDWGTQFGMLIEHLLEQEAQGVLTTDAHGATHIRDLNAFYQRAKKRFDDDPDFAQRARRRVVALQSGDEATLQRWHDLVDASKEHFNALYQRLGVTLTDAHLRPESYYNPLLPQVIAELAPLSTKDAGATCIFVPGFAGQDGSPVPLIVQKSDGGYGYATTDLAAIRDRVKNLGAERIIYVVDARQADHFAMVFWAAQQMGWLSDTVNAEHCRFGTILGPDNKPFKTRSGETVRLSDLLDEAIERARAIVAEKNADLNTGEQEEIARVVGIGAVKYGDLSSLRVKDYVFSWERMLAMDGNTAPYLQYAYARIQSIFRKAEQDPNTLTLPQEEGALSAFFAHPDERALMLKLVQLNSVVTAVATRLEPHHLCTYLYELASAFSTFYNSCPVLRADSTVLRNQRLLLCALTARTLKLGLNLLGIEVLERM